MGNQKILEVNNLKTHFFTKLGVVKAVDGVSFSVQKGQVMGLVGESGSGKSITGFSVLGLIESPGRIVGGEIKLNGEVISQLPEEQMRRYRGRKVAMIFQDPMMTLNPVLRIDTQMMEAITAHYKVSRSAALEKCRQALVSVGISSPDERLKAYPHQFSGGMRQRVAIATALLNEPDLIIADEPTTALDVTIQGQILHEVQKLCKNTGTALFWITHDLTVVAGLADTISVMYAGRIIEQGSLDQVLDQPAHPYTRGLISSIPSNNRRGEPLNQIDGMAPSLLNLPSSCAFLPRCQEANDLCSETPDESVLKNGKKIRCFNPLSGGGS